MAASDIDRKPGTAQVDDYNTCNRWDGVCKIAMRDVSPKGLTSCE